MCCDHISLPLPKDDHLNLKAILQRTYVWQSHSSKYNGRAELSMFYEGRNNYIHNINGNML